VKKYLLYIVCLSCLLALTAVRPVVAQTGQNNPLTASFDDPQNPGKVTIKWNNGDIHVKSHEGSDVKVEVYDRKWRRRDRWFEDDRDSGLRKIYDGQAVTVEKNKDTIYISCYTIYRHVDADIFVPADAELYIVNSLNGSVKISDTRDNIEIETLNGDIYLKNTSGSVNAYSTNGEIIATMGLLGQAESLVLTTLNSDIDVALPENLSATLNMTTRDEIYTDFDVMPVSTSTEEWRSRSRQKLAYMINGGGMEINIKSLHGNIYVRKGKSN